MTQVKPPSNMLLSRPGFFWRSLLPSRRLARKSMPSSQRFRMLLNNLGPVDLGVYAISRFAWIFLRGWATVGSPAQGILSRTKSMSRPLTIVLSAVALLGQVSVASVALAGGGGFHGAWGSHFSGGHGAFSGRFGRLAGPRRFFNRFGIPGEIVGYPGDLYDGSSSYGGYPAGQDCVVERLPISTPYGLGWRTFTICPN